MSTINLEQEILRENTAVLASEKTILDEQAKLDAEVEKVLANAEATYLDGIMVELGFNYKLDEAQRIRRERDAFAKLPQNRIMSLDAIRATCIKYGLRFLPTRYYKGALDSGIGPKLEEFRTAMGGKLPKVDTREVLMNSLTTVSGERVQMYIAAPSESFALQPMPRDPLLFCRLSEKKFYLLHKWGADLTTADVRKNEIDSNNWNSPFSSSAAGSLDLARMLGVSVTWTGSNNQAGNSLQAWDSSNSITTSTGSLW